MNDYELADQLRTRREELGWYQWQVAEVAQMNEKRYQAYESGNKMPTVRTLTKIARALGVRLALVADSEVGK